MCMLCACLTVCQFVQYDQRAHELQTLARFSFWVQSRSDKLSHCGQSLTYRRYIPLQQPTEFPSSLPTDRSSKSPRCFLSVCRVQNKQRRYRRAYFLPSYND